MKLTLKAEELLQFIFGIFLFSTLDFSWWWFLVLILAPDIGMIGYLFNTRLGAFTYNVLHHKGLAILLYLSGIYFENQYLLLIGVIMFAHAALDRFFGYGLKHSTGFKNTHLGTIGHH